MEKDKFVLKVDTICPECGLHNRLLMVLKEQASIVGCGRCGELLMHPPEMSDEEKKEVQKTISETIKMYAN